MAQPTGNIRVALPQRARTGSLTRSCHAPHPVAPCPAPATPAPARPDRPGRTLLTAVLCLALVTGVAAVVRTAAAANTVTVFYRPNPAWTTVNIHYAPTGGAWTAVPGVSMDAACTGWRRKTIDLGTATGVAGGVQQRLRHLGQQQRGQLQPGHRQRDRVRWASGTGDPCATASPSPAPSSQRRTVLPAERGLDHRQHPLRAARRAWTAVPGVRDGRPPAPGGARRPSTWVRPPGCRWCSTTAPAPGTTTTAATTASAPGITIVRRRHRHAATRAPPPRRHRRRRRPATDPADHRRRPPPPSTTARHDAATCSAATRARTPSTS